MVNTKTLILGLLGAAQVLADQVNKVESFTFRPERRSFQTHLVKNLKVESGFGVTVFATNLQNARMMIRGPKGQIYLSRYDQGDVLMLDCTAGLPAAKVTPVAKIAKVHGIALRDDTFFLASDRKLFRAQLKGDGTLESPIEIANLPDGGQHPRRTLGFDPNGMLYVSIGSTCNSCVEPNPEHATMLQMRPDGTGRRVFAKGRAHLGTATTTQQTKVGPSAHCDGLGLGR